MGRAETDVIGEAGKSGETYKHQQKDSAIERCHGPPGQMHRDRTASGADRTGRTGRTCRDRCGLEL